MQTPDEILDHTPITFGQFSKPENYKPLGFTRPLTPSEIAEFEGKIAGRTVIGADWLVWATENTGKKVCSELLYRNCKEGKERGDDDYGQPPKSAHPYKLKSMDDMDDMDDDIPF